MDQKKIGRFLKELRKEKDITQEQLAEKIKVSGRTVSRWETGSNMPDISLLAELADFYDVSISEIIDGESFLYNLNSGAMSIPWTQKVELFSQHSICRENYFYAARTSSSTCCGVL